MNEIIRYIFAISVLVLPSIYIYMKMREHDRQRRKSRELFDIFLKETFTKQQNNDKNREQKS